MKIYPAFDLAGNSHFLSSIEQLIEDLLPSEALKHKEDPSLFFSHLAPILPLLCFSQLKKEGNAFSVTVLSHAEYTHGTGRFLSDALSRRLIPGKIVELVGTRTLSFYFFPHDKREFLLNERWLMANHLDEIALIQQRLPKFIEQLRLTFSCIVKMRHFLSLNKGEEKWRLPVKVQHFSVFEQMQDVIERLCAETTIGQMRSYIAPLYKKRPKIFDRDIFEEIKPFISLYNEQFIGKRTLKSVVRLICYHFYFQKQLLDLNQSSPLKRHVLLKVFKYPKKLGVLILLNFFKENEILKKSQLIEALKHCIPHVQQIEESYLIDDSSETHVFFYIEIQKEGSDFAKEEIAALRSKLPIELKACIQRTVNPLFMLHNEEDHLRYLITLSREIRYVKDLPQLVILFDEQTEDSVIFSVIMVRLVTQKTLSIKDLLAQFDFKTLLREQKKIGRLRHYPKEACIFKVYLPKCDYLRKDYALDLPRARLAILVQIQEVFREVRDYNGGLLCKQLESLQLLKDLLGSTADDNTFALENFFFSIEPLFFQLALSPILLSQGFLLLLDLIQTNTSYRIDSLLAGFILSTSKQRESLLLLLEATRENFEDISYSFTYFHDLFCCVVFFPKKASELEEIQILLHSFLAQEKEDLCDAL